jgi:polyribonucleotide nucleotidyltransferase
MPIRYLIADQKNPQNLEEKRVLELIITIANQYNEVCENMENLAAKNGHHFMSEFKMSPTSFRGLCYL